MKHKRGAPAVLLALSVICLLAIGMILVTGIIKNRAKNPALVKKNADPNILGEIIQQQMTLAPTKISQLFQEPLQETKEIVSQKVVEIEKEVVTNIQKEISTLTQSQVETLKFQICRDLGVISPLPTPSEKP